MKKATLLICFTLFLGYAFAQDTLKYKLINVSERLAFSNIKLIDSYLSPLTYVGNTINYLHTETKFLTKQNDKISQTDRIEGSVGVLENSSNTSYITYAGFKYNWGVHYHFKEINGFRFFAGANIGGQYAMKLNTRNINNPYNMDLATDLNLSGLAKYNLQLPKFNLTITYQLEFPVMGCMFVPEMGASYYEIADLGVLSNAFHFTSLHNRFGYQSVLNFEIPFKYSTWTIGGGVNNLKYIANDMYFETNNSFVQIGVRYDISKFAGSKIKAPSVFRNPNL